MTTRMRVGSWA